jgi:hypothetical protein
MGQSRIGLAHVTLGTGWACYSPMFLRAREKYVVSRVSLRPLQVLCDLCGQAFNRKDREEYAKRAKLALSKGGSIAVFLSVLDSKRCQRERQASRTHRSSVLKMPISGRREIMPTTQETKCAHPQCSCEVSDEKQYCSQACSDAAKRNDVQSACGCEHPNCERTAQAA